MACCSVNAQDADIIETLMFKAANSTFVTFPSGTPLHLYNYPRLGVKLDDAGVAASDIKTIGVVFSENLESSLMKLFYGWGPGINDQTSSNKNLTTGSKEYTLDIKQADKDAGKTIYRFGIYYTNDISKNDKPAANLAIEKLYIIDKDDVRTEYTEFQTFSTGSEVFQTAGNVIYNKQWAEIEITDAEHCPLSVKSTDGEVTTYKITFDCTSATFGDATLTLRFNYNTSNQYTKSFSIKSSTVTDNGDGTCYYQASISPSDIPEDKDVITIRLTLTSVGSYSYGIKSITRVGREAVTIKNAVNDEGWTTYCNTKRLEYSRKDDMEAYIVTARNASTGALTLQKVSIVPGNSDGEGVTTPVILRIPQMNGLKEVTFGIPSTTLTADDVSANMLHASTGDGFTVTADGNTYYALANKKYGVGFYKVRTGVTIPKGRAYLIVNNNQELSAREFWSFDEGGSESTDITSIVTEMPTEGESAVYDLMGRRVQKTQRGHLYIRNGRKFIAK